MAPYLNQRVRLVDDFHTSCLDVGFTVKQRIVSKGGDPEDPAELWAVITLLHQIGNKISSLEQKVEQRLDAQEKSMKTGQEVLNNKVEKELSTLTKKVEAVIENRTSTLKEEIKFQIDSVENELKNGQESVNKTMKSGMNIINERMGKVSHCMKIHFYKQTHRRNNLLTILVTQISLCLCIQ